MLDAPAAAPGAGPALLMVAYTDYASDPRVIRAAEAAAAAGFHVDVLSLAPRQEGATPPGIRLLPLRQRRYRGGRLLNYLLSYSLFLLRCLAHAVRHARRYRIVHVHNMPDFLVFCALPCRACGAAVILDIHDPMPETFSAKFRGSRRGVIHRLLLAQERLSASFAHRVVAPHEPLRRFVLQQRHRLPAAKLSVVANYPSGRLFPARKAEDFGSLRLVFHGTILERYGLATALQALRPLRDQPGLSLLIIGDGDFSPQLQALIRELDLGRIVTFRRGRLPLEEVPAAIAGANVGLVPLELNAATAHALSLKLLEYIALGLPVITVPTPLHDFYFAAGDLLLYRPEDPASLTRLLHRLLADRSLLEGQRRRSLRLRERFLWENEQARYAALLHELAATRRPARPRRESPRLSPARQ